MSEPTLVHPERSVEDRVNALEDLVKYLTKSHNDILKLFYEAMEVISELSEEVHEE
mgnify:CR=1 FL=1|tara:strand:+ start:190 stop:357 length:168 start_codon:yes stop_codon:yes gene_type:complete